MGRAEIVALLASVSLLAMFVWHRARLYRRRAEGPSLDLLRRFDYRVVWDELLSEGGREHVSPGGAEPPAPGPGGLPEAPGRAALRAALLAGESPALDPGDETARALGCRCAIRRVLSGDLAGARSLAARLPAESAALLLAAIELARAERCEQVRDKSGARRAVFSAFEHAERGLRLQGRTVALEYLMAHLRLAWLTHDANLEWSVGRTLFSLQRALQRWGERPCLHFARAHAQALLGRHDEALDELARAFYHSDADAFYARAILECGFVAQARPTLLAQCQAQSEERAARPARPLSPSEDDR